MLENGGPVCSQPPSLFRARKTAKFKFGAELQPGLFPLPAEGEAGPPPPSRGVLQGRGSRRERGDRGGWSPRTTSQGASVCAGTGASDIAARGGRKFMEDFFFFLFARVVFLFLTIFKAAHPSALSLPGVPTRAGEGLPARRGVRAGASRCLPRPPPGPPPQPPPPRPPPACPGSVQLGN